MARKSNREYWKKRFEVLEDEQYRQSEAYYRDMEEQFRRASNSIQMDIEHWYRRLADNNDISLAGAKRLLKKNELEEFHWSVEEYIKRGQENAVDQRWMKELENASARHHISYLEAMKLQVQQHAELLHTSFEGGMEDYLRKAYGEQYYRSAFEISKGFGVGFNIARLDEDKIDLIIKRPWAQDGQSFSDRIWTNKQKLVQNLHTELTQSIIRGEAPQKAIGRLARDMDTSKAQAGRLIMTESAAISSVAHRQCFQELDVERYEILATLDSRTSEICREMDGKVFEMKDYQEGLTAPPFHPWCRTTTVPYFDDDFTVGEQRAARDEESGKTVYVDGKLNYKEWKEQLSTEHGQIIDKNCLKLPDDIMKIKGMTEDDRIRLEKTITIMQKKYDIQIGGTSVESFGRGERGTYFIAGPYLDDGKLKMGLVINQDIDYTKIEQVIQKRYNSGFFASRTIEDCIKHELAHVMTFQGCTSYREYKELYAEINNAFVPGISGYADKCQDGVEMLAEAFVRIQNGEKVPLSVRLLVKKYIERWRL